MAGRLARFGSDRLGPPTREIAADGPGSTLAVEALGVLLRTEGAAVLIALLAPARTPGERLALLAHPVDGPADPGGWLRELVEDPGEVWRSPWLRACAIRAARVRGVVDTMGLASGGGPPRPGRR